MRKLIRRAKAKTEGKLTGYELTYVVRIGMNAYNKAELQEDYDELAKIIEARLSNYPVWVEKKGIK